MTKVPQNEPRKRGQMDVAIITVVTEETRAVLKALDAHGLHRNRDGQQSSRLFYEGELPGRAGLSHRVVCTQTVNQGSRSFMSAYNDVLNEYSPRLVVLLGIAGGLHKDMRLCDVAFADQIFYYDKRKETAHQTIHRGEGYRVESWLMSRLNAFLVQHGEPAEFPSAPNSISDRFHARVGPIGAGEAVVAYKEAEVRQWLRTVNDKTLALETEAGGMGAAFFEERMRRGYKVGGYLVIRGVSDHADADKDDKWRQPSADNAAIALSELLRTLPAISSLLPDP